MSILKIGKIYQLFTVYETLFNVKVKVIGILSYEQAKKVSYDMNVLAINEKVIGVADEDLETIIENANNDIYHCRSTVANSDGSYSEYIVWDDIIDKEKTSQINTEYVFNLKLTLNSSATTSISQIISALETYIQNSYGTMVSSSITNKSISDGSSDGTTSEIDDYKEKIAQAELVLNGINKLSNTLIPAADKLASTDFVSIIDTINSEIISINQSISTIAGSIR